MNYDEKLIVVAKAGNIDVKVEDEKIFYLLNKKMSALCHKIRKIFSKFNVNHLDLIHKTYKLLYQKNV